MIAFIGSVFSPYYAFARRRGPADPLAHCAINVALYGKSVRRWAMTERGAGAVERGPQHFRVGPSQLVEDGNDLVIILDERGMPLPQAVRGEIRLRPQALGDTSYCLNPAGQHVWRPLAPFCRVEAKFSKPDLNWAGHGYLDHNRGAEPLEAGFTDWHWCRAHGRNGALVGYHGRHHDGREFSLGLAFAPDGTATRFPLPAARPLPSTFWRIHREVPAEAGQAIKVLETLEDTPFYARSVVETALNGERVAAMHESLSLTRFRQPIVQAMLPFRMPRRG